MVAPATLPFLLWTALGKLEQEYIHAGAGRDRRPTLDLWANLLRALDAAGVNSRELPAILRLSKRAVRSRIAEAVRKGWVEQQKSGTGRAVIRLTASGAEVSARWEALQTAAEKRWRVQAGVDLSRALRASLEIVVAALPLEHPHYPASYGAADASITGGGGQDWKAVQRGSGDTVSHLPLSALLSQVLVAFAMDYERKSPVALSLSTAVMQRISPEGRRLEGLGQAAGVSALVRHGFIRVSGSKGSEIVFLTPKGLAANEAYEERIQGVETEWRTRFGEAQVFALRRALEEVAAPRISSLTLVTKPQRSSNT